MSFRPDWPLGVRRAPVGGSACRNAYTRRHERRSDQVPSRSPGSAAGVGAPRFGRVDSRNASSTTALPAPLAPRMRYDPARTLPAVPRDGAALGSIFQKTPFHTVFAYRVDLSVFGNFDFRPADRLEVLLLTVRGRGNVIRGRCQSAN